MTQVTREHSLTTAFSGQPEAVRKIVETLRRDAAAMPLLAIQSGFATTLILAAKDGTQDVRVELTYTDDELKYAEIGDGGKFQSVDTVPIESASSAAIAASQKLIGWGFQLVHSDTTAIRPVYLFVRGKKIPGKEAVLGIRAQLTTLDMANGFGHGE